MNDAWATNHKRPSQGRRSTLPPTFHFQKKRAISRQRQGRAVSVLNDSSGASIPFFPEEQVPTEILRLGWHEFLYIGFQKYKTEKSRVKKDGDVYRHCLVTSASILHRSRRRTESLPISHVRGARGRRAYSLHAF